MIQVIPKMLQTDKDTELRNKESEELCKHNKINKIFGH